MLMFAIIAFAVAGTVLATAWAALIVQSLAGSGLQKTYFASEVKCDFAIDDEDCIILRDHFGFVDSNGELVDAPAGLESDGASVKPLLFIPIIGTLVVWLIKGTPLQGPLRVGAIPHDALYAAAQEKTFWSALISSKRAHADRIIFEAATCSTYRLGGPFEMHRIPLETWRAFAVMAILRLLGFKAWIDDSRAGRSLRRQSPDSHPAA